MTVEINENEVVELSVREILDKDTYQLEQIRRELNNIFGLLVPISPNHSGTYLETTRVLRKQIETMEKEIIKSLKHLEIPEFLRTKDELGQDMETF